MKQSKFILGIFVLTVAFSISSCKDDDDSPSKTILLTSKSWRVTDERINNQSIYDDYYSDCEKDDLLKFGIDGKVTNDQGAVKCDSSDPQSSSGGVWVFESNETKLKLTDTDGDTQIFEIKELTVTSMKLLISATNAGTIGDVEIIFTAQ